MLQPTSRPPRALMGASLFFSLALVWPVAISAAPLAPSGATTSTAAPRSERTPTVAGRGIKSFGASRGPGPKQKQELKIDRAKRGTAATDGTAPSGGGSKAVLAVPPPPDFATVSGAPATSFGPWEGFNQTSAAAVCPPATTCPGPLLEPPDPWVGVGPDHVIQTVNTDIHFANREGTTVAEAQDAYQFFDLGNLFIGSKEYDVDGWGDPRWLYDQKHNRWLGLLMGWHCDEDGAGTADESWGFMFGAISLTGDPTGDYYQYVFGEPNFLHDFPMIGTSGDKFTLASNDYELLATADCTNGALNAGASLTTADWAHMLGYPLEPFVDIYYYPAVVGDPNFYFSPRPAVSPQGLSNTIYGVIETGTAMTTSDVQYFTITGTVMSVAGTSVSNVNLSAAGVVAPFADPPAPVQPGGAFPGSVVDRRPTDAIWQGNVLTFASTYPCDPVGSPVELRDCARVTQLNTSTATPTRVQDVLIGSTDKDTWYPGIGQSQNGTLHVVYTESSSSQGMSSLDRYQTASDPATSFSAPVEIASGGSTHYNGVRWGDFVGVAQDPRDTNAVWQGNQYTKSNGQWGTRVSQLQTAGSTFVPIAPTRLLDTRPGGTGLSGAFTSNVARTLQIGGRNGIPDQAVAITGNLTVTLQTAAGYLAVTRTPVNLATTSTLNFPLGDNRANNFTSPLDVGRLSIVYNAVAGRSAHVILDVTGYFLNSPSGATYKTVVPSRSLDSRDCCIGTSGAFAHGVVRTWQVTGRNDIPNDAIAVTGNLTVTGQTTRGFVTIGPTVASEPTTSTLNFPLGDNRANGVTVRLAPDGSLQGVFRGTVASASAHVIFDVTGFYVQDLTGARFVALSPGRRMDTRAAAPLEGLTGPFVADTARTLIIEPYQGVPGNATAITGNLTVVGQSKRGFVSMTPTATNNPQTSSLNFPVGDIRANGVTGPLAGDGSVGLVYEVSSGTGTTHLILDLTGYFR